MNKARIILSAVALLAVIGGAFAFKAMRTGFSVVTTTTAISANETIYTLAGGGSFCWTKTNQFFTNPPFGTLAIGVLTTTAPATGVITLTKVGGTQTITIPNYCTVTSLTTSRTTGMD